MAEKLAPDTIHRPTGSYTHAVSVSAKRLVFIAGQIPMDHDGKIVGYDPYYKDQNHQTIDLSAQIRQAYKNLISALESAGASLKDLVRLDSYVLISVLNEYRTTGNKVREEMLGEHHPPGATVFVAGLMPPHALIEISGIAAIE